MLCRHSIGCRESVQNLIRAVGVRGRFELGQNSVFRAPQDEQRLRQRNIQIFAEILERGCCGLYLLWSDSATLPAIILAQNILPYDITLGDEGNKNDDYENCLDITGRGRGHLVSEPQRQSKCEKVDRFPDELE